MRKGIETKMLAKTQYRCSPASTPAPIPSKYNHLSSSSSCQCCLIIENCIDFSVTLLQD